MSDHRGILFRPNPRGSQRLPDGRRGDWLVSYVCAAGHRHREKIGPKGLAREEHGRLRVKVRREAYCPAAVRRQRPVTVRDLSRRYLEYATVNKRSWLTDQYRLVPLLEAFGESLLTDVRPERVERYKADRLASVAPGTVNREVALLRRMLALAIEWELLDANPMQAVKGLKEPPGRLRYLSPEEMTALLDACAPRLRPIVVCALNTGMRQGEILRLQWPQVDLRQRLIRVTHTKTGEARTIPINDALLEELRRLPRRLGAAAVFAKDDTGAPYVDCWRAFHVAAKRAGLKDFRFHDLRHTFASYVQMGLGDLRATQTLLGHRDIRMTLRYAHLSDARLREAVAVLPVSGTSSGTGPAAADSARPSAEGGTSRRA
jgi:integrase